MDEVFGIKNFRNDITRIKCTTKSFSRSAYGNIKDLILFYTKTENSIWNEPREELDEAYLSKQYNKIDSNGRAYSTVPLTAPGESNGVTGKPWKGVKLPKGRHWATTHDELNKLDEQGLIEWSRTGNPRRIIYRETAVERGKKVQDVWEYKDPQYPKYPTEKNVGLLKRIIGASSNEDSLVLDCFCGGGGTLVISEMMNRNWIGVDKSDMAIQVTKDRLQKECNLKENNYKYIEM
jgi:adenine-specific DNA-methyltransferase